MWSWKLKELSCSACCAVSLLFSLSIGGSAFAQTTMPPTSLGIKVTLIGISSFSEAQEIEKALKKEEGTRDLNLEIEAPGLITSLLHFEGDSKTLVGKLSTDFAEKYSVVLKDLPSGMQEIAITKKGS